jgi:hypothetical protein
MEPRLRDPKGASGEAGPLRRDLQQPASEVLRVPTSPEAQMAVQIEPGYRRIQREHGENPPKSDSEALANIAAVVPGIRIIGPTESR